MAVASALRAWFRPPLSNELGAPLCMAHYCALCRRSFDRNGAGHVFTRVHAAAVADTLKKGRRDAGRVADCVAALLAIPPTAAQLGVCPLEGVSFVTVPVKHLLPSLSALHRLFSARKGDSGRAMP